MNIFSRLSLVCLLSAIQSAYAGMDDKTLKEYLSRNFTADESMPWEERSRFKASRDISDEQLYRLLMEIYNEASKKRSSLTPETRPWYDNRRTIEGILGWLPVCGDIPIKDFLMDYAVVRENDSLNRRAAVLSYLRTSDAEEAKNALLRFLVEGDRMDSQARSSICAHARTAFMDANPEKKEAILYSLIIALSREDTKWLFHVYDDILCKISKEYENSRQRIAILQRLINAPSLCKADDYLMPELQEKLKNLQKLRPYYNVSTNLAVIKARNFNLPLQTGVTNELIQTISDSVTPESLKTGEVNHRVVMLAFLGGIAVILLGLGAWKFTRK